MSAQSTINQRMSGRLHIGPIGAAVAIAAALAGIGLVIALLWPSAMAPKPAAAPAFDAAAFRAEEKVALAASASSSGTTFVGDRGLAPRTYGSATFAGDRGIAPRTSASSTFVGDRGLAPRASDN